jgi:homoserine dehydrogenase
VRKAGPIGSLRGADNILCLTSGIYSKTPLVVQVAGADPDITAAGVIADMVDIARRGISGEGR